MKAIQEFSRSYPLVRNIVLFLVSGIVLHLLRKFVLNRLYVHLKGSSNWHGVRKTAFWINIILLVIVFLNIFGNDLSGFSTAIGLAGAGIAYALKEVIASFAGCFGIIFGDFFKSGDRILLGGIRGDVVDIGFLRTTLMELGEWVDGDQYTGRIVRISNSYVFTSPVYNYQAHFEFLWDEIQIPIRFGSDVKEMREILMEIAQTYTSSPDERAKQQWISMQRKYKLEVTSLKPQVYVAFNDNWIEVTLRYIVYFNKRREVKDHLFTEILNEIEKRGSSIEIASETIEVTQYAK